MKFGNPFNKVAITTGTFVVALMTGLGTVNAGDQFTTEVEQQAVRTKAALFNQVGADTPESVKATGNQAMNTVNSVTDAAGGARDAVSITAQQAKAQSDAKIADLERKLANAGGGSKLTTKSSSKSAFYYVAGTCAQSNKNGCVRRNYNVYKKTAHFMEMYQDGKLLSKNLSSCTRQQTHNNIPLYSVPSGATRGEKQIAPGC